MESREMTHWFAFRTAPQKEFASEELIGSRIGLESFVPREKKWRRVGHKRRRTAFTYPMLPRYVFAALPAQHKFFAMHKILALDPVQGVVGFGDGPIRIPDHAITSLKRISGHMIATRHQPVHKSFVPGDKVEIIDGPFRGHVVPVLGINGKKAKVLHALFGANMELTISTDSLEAA